MIHDWLFTEQFLKTSLLLPVAFGYYDENEALVVQVKRRVETTILVTRLCFYCLVALWSFMSMYSGMFIIRMAINAVFFFVTAIFMRSLYRIKQQISVIDRKKVLHVNYGLMNLNLFTFGAQAVLYFTAFVLAFFSQSEVDG